MFGASFFVPPNTIDFSSVFDNFGEKLVENIHVVVMIALLLILYALLVILMRRMDKKDKVKVGACDWVHPISSL